MNTNLLVSGSKLKNEPFPCYGLLGLPYLTTIVSDRKWESFLQVTFIEALDQLMPGFDPEISKLAQRVLINPRKIDYHTGVFATKVSLLKNSF